MVSPQAFCTLQPGTSVHVLAVRLEQSGGVPVQAVQLVPTQVNCGAQSALVAQDDVHAPSAPHA